MTEISAWAEVLAQLEQPGPNISTRLVGRAENRHVIDRKIQPRLKKKPFKWLYFCLFYF
jgi:hypothetical protein